MPSRRRLQLLFLVVVVTAALVVGGGLIGASGGDTIDDRVDERRVSLGDSVSQQSDGITVVATDSNNWESGPNEGPRGTSELIALGPNGTVLYVDGSHDKYWDVDPVEGTQYAVEYVFSDHLEEDECPTDLDREQYSVSEETWHRYERDDDRCTRNGVERVNLRTGEVSHVWSHVTPGGKNTRYHDVDRLDAERLVVADIYFDRVFVVNTASGRIEWTWNATDDFSTDTGGPYPADWTHVNDVEVLSDDRIMVSLRNHDQVVFLDGDGVRDGWTLGTDDDHGTLYEQHNPDFIPEGAGGPAILVADSEHNRVVEFQRAEGEWTRTWHWRDARLQWPRDADRLPNGHTLITDSNGNRVFEVDDRGTVVWSVDVAFPYEAERIATGDESADGPSARAADLDPRTESFAERIWIGVKSSLPGKYLNGLMYLTPVWMGFAELLGLAVALVTGLVWSGFELRWARRRRRS